MRLSPWRAFYPKSTLTIEQKDDYCIFTATVYFRWGPISSRSKRVKKEALGGEEAYERGKEESEGDIGRGGIIWQIYFKIHRESILFHLSQTNSKRISSYE